MNDRATIAELDEMMALCRRRGCTQLRNADVAIVLGPEPLPPAEPTDRPHVVREETPDEAAVREYREHLFGEQMKNGHG